MYNLHTVESTYFKADELVNVYSIAVMFSCNVQLPYASVHNKASLVAQLGKNPLKTWFNSWVRKILWRRDSLPTPVFWQSPHARWGSIPGLGRSPGEGKGYPRERLVFWPGEFQGLYSPLVLKESDMTEQLSLHYNSIIIIAQNWRQSNCPSTGKLQMKHRILIQ